jgi:hypothetical protein
VTTFNVPMLAGRFIRGAATQADVTGSGIASANNATFTAHGYTQTGIKVRMASGALTGLATATVYYVIVVDANTLAFATSHANALIGTKITISGVNSAVITNYEDPDASTREAGTVGAQTGRNVGSTEEDVFKSHTHNLTAANGTVNVQSGAGANIANNVVSFNTSATGGNETRPRNVYMNYIIKT